MTDLIDITTPADQQEGTVAVLRSWLKKPGEAIRKDEPIAELETDKVAVEIASPADGILREVLSGIDDEIQPGTAIARMSPAEVGDIDTASQATPANADAISAPTDTKETRYSPAVRRLLVENNLDGSKIIGTGRGSRLTKQDVLGYLESTPVQTAPTPVPQNIDGAAALFSSGDDVVSIPNTSMRKQIATHMHKSVTVAPHVTAVFEADLNAIVADRKRQKESFQRRGVKLTYTAYFLRACVEAIRVVPEVNSRFFDDRVEIFRRMNIGVGVALGDKGLVVPVIHDAQDLDLFGIASKLDDVTTRAQANALKPQDVKGGTFSISNHGVSGSLLAAPIIINQPQSAILGLGKMEKRVVVEETASGDVIAIKNMAFVTLSIDHRVLDGHQTNKFLSVFTEKIASWSE